MDYFELQETDMFYFLSNAISRVSLYIAVEGHFFLNTKGIAAIFITNKSLTNKDGEDYVL
jgi:hypothetical protein